MTVEQYVDKYAPNYTLSRVKDKFNFNPIYVINPPINSVAYACTHTIAVPVSDEKNGCKSTKVQIEQYFDTNGKSLGYVFTDGREHDTNQKPVEYPKTRVLLRVFEKNENSVYKVGVPKDTVFPANSDLVKFIRPQLGTTPEGKILYGNRTEYVQEISPGKYRVNERSGKKLVAHIFDDSGKEVDKYDVNIYKPDKFKSAQKKVVAKGKTSRVIKPAEKEY